MQWTTKAVVSEWSLGYLASLLALSSYFEEKDPDYNSNRVLSQSQHLDASARDREIVYSTKLSLVLKSSYRLVLSQTPSVQRTGYGMVQVHGHPSTRSDREGLQVSISRKSVWC